MMMMMMILMMMIMILMMMIMISHDHDDASSVCSICTKMIMMTPCLSAYLSHTLSISISIRYIYLFHICLYSIYVIYVDRTLYASSWLTI